MKAIEKSNGQIFEIYNKTEFIQMVKDITCCEKTWIDNDSTLFLIYKDGTNRLIEYGDTLKPLRLSEIVQAQYSNPNTNAIYNCKIIYNERYEDYEVEV